MLDLIVMVGFIISGEGRNGFIDTQNLVIDTTFIILALSTDYNHFYVMAAILAAILNISKCSMVLSVHHTDSRKLGPRQLKTIKNTFVYGQNLEFGHWTIWTYIALSILIKRVMPDQSMIILYFTLIHGPLLYMYSEDDTYV